MQPSTGLFFILSLSLSLVVNAGPLKNGESASSLKYVTGTALLLVTYEPIVADQVSNSPKFKTPNPSPPCGTDETGSPGTTTTNSVSGRENTVHILAARAVVPANDSSQSSLTLDPTVISTSFQKDGQDNITAPGQS